MPLDTETFSAPADDRELAIAPGRPMTRSETLADRVVHGVGLCFGIGGCVALARVALAGSATQALALGLYGFGLILMLSCSAANHFDLGGRRGDLINRVDQAGIFVMIAGTYTPFSLLGLGGPEGTGLCALVWAGALAGAATSLLRPDWLARVRIPAYLTLGWTVILAFGAVEAALPGPAFTLLVAGGLLYNVGVAVFVARRLPYRQALWHVFVLSAALCHFAAILGWLAHPILPA